MALQLSEVKEELLPGTIQITIRYASGWIDSRAMDFWRLGPITFTPVKPHIWVPKLTLPEAAVVGAAAAIITNPVVTRRFWSGWGIKKAAPKGG